MTTLLCYNSPEYYILLDTFQNTKLDKWIARNVESFIYEWKEKTYKNITLKEIYLTRFGEKDGEYKELSNNQLIVYGHYKEGKREGEYKQWLLNGQLYIHCYYKGGKREGEYKRLWKNGQLWIYCHFKEDKEEDEYKQWFENGQLWIYCHFKEGKEEGAYKEWNEEGVLIKDEVYHNGEKISVV